MADAEKLEALKKGKEYHHDGYYLSERASGWNDCIDHLISAAPQPPATEPAKPAFVQPYIPHCNTCGLPLYGKNSCSSGPSPATEKKPLHDFATAKAEVAKNYTLLGEAAKQLQKEREEPEVTAEEAREALNAFNEYMSLTALSWGLEPEESERKQKEFYAAQFTIRRVLQSIAGAE